MANKGRKLNHKSWSKWTSRSLGGLVCWRMNKERESSQNKKKSKEREKSFLTNGGILLEDLIASSNGKCNPIRNFSAEELIKATKNFDPSHVIDEYQLHLQDCITIDGKIDATSEVVTYYRGSFDDRTIIVKKYLNTTLSSCWEDIVRSHAIRDIVIATQMSNHKNVLKLIGCCLEFPIPALVHEYAANGPLNDQGGYGDDEILPWKIRLRIAKELANALTYLHTALSRPVIHRNIRPTSIFLDHNFVPKFCNFSLSITIPPEQSHASDNVVQMVDWHSHPEYLKSCIVTEKSDVYSFGVLLFIFLTGQKAAKVRQAPEYQPLLQSLRDHIQNELVTEIVDPNILREEGGDEQAQQVKAFLALALACTQEKDEARPNMIDVAKELMRIEKLIVRKLS